MDPRIEQAITLMTRDLGQDVSFSEIARSINISNSRFRYLFTLETGLPPLQYLKSKRMQRAKDLLETTFLNVKEIMLEVGIKDQSHFVRDFQGTYGLTPAMYRAHHIKARTQSARFLKAVKSANE